MNQIFQSNAEAINSNPQTRNNNIPMTTKTRGIHVEDQNKKRKLA